MCVCVRFVFQKSVIQTVFDGSHCALLRPLKCLLCAASVVCAVSPCFYSLGIRTAPANAHHSCGRPMVVGISLNSCNCGLNIVLEHRKINPQRERNVQILTSFCEAKKPQTCGHFLCIINSRRTWSFLKFIIAEIIYRDNSLNKNKLMAPGEALTIFHRCARCYSLSK